MDECEVWADGRIRCHAVSRDNLAGPAGALIESYWSFWVSDGKISKVSSGPLEKSTEWFLIDMTAWLENTYPEVWKSTFAVPGEGCEHDEEYNCWDNWYSNAETAAVLLEYRDEFIAQSDKYPLGE
jgi:hypothetical protein